MKLEELFKRASCGCIGIPTGEDELLAFTNCCGTDEGATRITLRAFRIKKGEPAFTDVTSKEVQEILDKLHSLVVDGDKLQQIRALLR
jgi:hypothetical protein